MKAFHLLISILISTISSFAVAAEGGPSWWWDCKGDDFIVRGKIEYGDQPHIEIKWHNEEGKLLTIYYIKGTLKIDNVLFLNPHNRYPDSYKYHLRNLKSEHDVLIPAQRVYWEHMKNDDMKVVPSAEVPKGQAIMILNVDYVFPIEGLVLQSVVPKDKETEAEQLIRERRAKDETAEQGGADQPATAPESKPEGKEKPKPESEGRPQ